MAAAVKFGMEPMAEAAPKTLTSSVQQPASEHEVFPPFDASNYPSQLLWLAIAFGLLYWVLARSVLPKFSSLLEDRRNRIAADLKEAATHKAEAEAAARAYEASLVEAKKQAAQIAATSRAAVLADIDARHKVADAQIAEHLREAEGRITTIKAEGLSQVGAIAAETAVAVVSHLVHLDVSVDEASAAVAH